MRLGKSFPCYNVDMTCMEKNLDLIRDIMLYVAAYYPHKNEGKALVKLTPDMFPEWVGREGFRDALDYHVEVLFDDKMLFFWEMKNHRGQIVGKMICPTSAGSDFLNEIRDPKWFAKIKKAIGDKPWTISYVREIRKELWDASIKRAANLTVNAIYATSITGIVFIFYWASIGIQRLVDWLSSFFC